MGLRRSLRRFFKAFLCGATPQDEESEKPSTPYHSYPTYPPRSAETNDQQPYIISPPPTLLAVHAHRQDHAPPSRLVTPQNQQQAALEHQRHQNALLLQHQKHQDTFLEHQRQQETNLEQQRQQAEFQEQQLEQLIQLEAQQRRQAPSQSRRPSMSRARLKIDHRENHHYRSLRGLAQAEGNHMAMCLQESQAAYQAQNYPLAEQLYAEGEWHRAEQQRLDREACTWIYQANNGDRPPNEVDLKGLYVEEARELACKAFYQAVGRQEQKILFIVGKGLHSSQEVAEIKSAIEELMNRHGKVTTVDPRNSGVLIVALRG